MRSGHERYDNFPDVWIRVFRLMDDVKFLTKKGNYTVNEMIALLLLAAFGLFYMTGGCHVWHDGWRPWKHGYRWWDYYH